MTDLPPESAESDKSLMQTRVPDAMRTYLKAYCKYHGIKMETLLAEILGHFIRLRPDLRGITLRTPQSHRKPNGSQGGWAQINLQIEGGIARKVAELATQTGVSRATISYTALYWFVRYLRPARPPAAERSASRKRSMDVGDSSATTATGEM